MWIKSNTHHSVGGIVHYDAYAGKEKSDNYLPSTWIGFISDLFCSLPENKTRISRFKLPQTRFQNQDECATGKNGLKVE